jgi:two-component system cell cycle response regulator DivK
MTRKTHTLLIVDSSASHRFYLGTMLRRLEYLVRSVPSAEDAMKSMIDEPPSLVIMDYMLPDMNGIDLFRRMKRVQRLTTVPAIMQSAEDDPGMKERCMAEGCMAYFKKPADIETLYTVIQAGLESSPRQTIRIETAFRVEISDESVPGGAVRQEYATALSDGGLYVRSINPDPLNTSLTLKMFISDRTITATVTVLYSTREFGGGSGGPGMGLKFVTISNSDRNYIRDYIKQQISQGLSL